MFSHQSPDRVLWVFIQTKKAVAQGDTGAGDQLRDTGFVLRQVKEWRRLYNQVRPTGEERMGDGTRRPGEDVCILRGYQV